jgi:hypothetical protein
MAGFPLCVFLLPLLSAISNFMSISSDFKVFNLFIFSGTRV